MILAAGKGTRLRPLTDKLPKALVPIAGQPALQWQIQLLERLGFSRIRINTHYLAEQVDDFVKNHKSQVELSVRHEPEILDTGGGVCNNRDFFTDQATLLHNVDVFSTIDLKAAVKQHIKERPLATLVCKNRPTQTKLLFDERGQLCGVHYYKKQELRMVRKAEGAVRELGFCGIHVLNSDLFSHVLEWGAFPIIPLYLRLAAENHAISLFDAEKAYWVDVGTPEKLAQVDEAMRIDESLRKHYG